jgi:Na+-transporting NADH:ubiquinone oxidoreductase subunit NqrD
MKLLGIIGAFMKKTALAMTFTLALSFSLVTSMGDFYVTKSSETVIGLIEPMVA